MLQGRVFILTFALHFLLLSKNSEFCLIIISFVVRIMTFFVIILTFVVRTKAKAQAQEKAQAQAKVARLRERL